MADPHKNSPSVIRPESFTAPSRVATFTVGEDCAAGWACSSAFQSGQSDAVRVPERLSGRIAPSVPVVHSRAAGSPASTSMAQYSVGFAAAVLIRADALSAYRDEESSDVT